VLRETEGAAGFAQQGHTDDDPTTVTRPPAGTYRNRARLELVGKDPSAHWPANLGIGSRGFQSISIDSDDVESDAIESNLESVDTSRP
jgi:hypothetical protein